MRREPAGTSCRHSRDGLSGACRGERRQWRMTRTVRASPPTFSADDFRAALAMFATGVTIVTARSAAGEPIGLTAHSFNSVSIAPPLVLWSLSRQAGSMAAFERGSHYAIHILAAD